jgi:hypothetical protein
MPWRLITAWTAGSAFALAMGGALNSAYAADDAQAIEPEAARVLKQMSDYLGSLEQFTVRSENTIDTVLQSGQLLQMGAHVDIAIQRPSRFRVNRKADIVDQEFYFDGKTLTLYGKRVKYYSRMTASRSVDIDTALELAEEEVGVFMPAADLFYKNPYQRLMDDAQSGFHAGTSIVGGVEVHHLAFRGSEVDWQIWIEKGDRPLPRKYLITSKRVAGAPQFTAVLSDWKTSVKLDDALFQFSPPSGAEEIGFIRKRRDTAATR